MRRRNRTIRLPWHRLSAWMINNFSACHLRGFLETILRVPAPVQPRTALGIALHEVFRKFLTPHKRTGRFPYDTEKKLIGAFGGLWWGAIGKPDAPPRHGFDGFASPPVDVAWERKEQPGQLYAESVNILKRFFELHDQRRHDGIVRLVERDFTYDWEGLPIGGRVDRIDLESDGAVIYDYKPWPQYVVEARNGIQMTIYQLGYLAVLRKRIPGQPPLKGLRIYSYQKGTEQELPIRHKAEIGLIRQHIFEVLWLLKGALLGEPVPEIVLEQFRFIDRSAVLRDDLLPHYPMGNHCLYCRYVPECEERKLKPAKPARLRFMEHRRERYDALYPNQLRLMLADLPLVVDGQSRYDRLFVPVADQQDFDF